MIKIMKIILIIGCVGYLLWWNYKKKENWNKEWWE